MGELRDQIAELKKNLPKNVASRMEREAKVRAEEEADTGDNKKSKCSIS